MIPPAVPACISFEETDDGKVVQPCPVSPATTYPYLSSDDELSVSVASDNHQHDEPPENVTDAWVIRTQNALRGELKDIWHALKAVGNLNDQSLILNIQQVWSIHKEHSQNHLVDLRDRIIPMLKHKKVDADFTKIMEIYDTLEFCMDRLDRRIHSLTIGTMMKPLLMEWKDYEQIVVKDLFHEERRAVLPLMVKHISTVQIQLLTLESLVNQSKRYGTSRIGSFFHYMGEGCHAEFVRQMGIPNALYRNDIVPSYMKYQQNFVSVVRALQSTGKKHME